MWRWGEKVHRKFFGGCQNLPYFVKVLYEKGGPED
jgi:hypothetical protein